MVNKHKIISLFFLLFIVPKGLKAQFSVDTVLANGYYKKGSQYYHLQRFDSAEFYFIEGKKIFEEYQLWDDFFKCETGLIDIAVATFNLNRAEEKINDFLLSVKDRLGSGHRHEGSAYVLKANVNLYRNEMDQALRNYKLGLEIYQNQKNTSYIDVSNVNFNLGALYNFIGEFDSALYYTEKSLEADLYVFDENHRRILENYINISYSYYRRGYYAKAHEYADKGLKTLIESNNQDNLLFGRFLHSKSGIFLEEKQIENTLKYAFRALDIFYNTYEYPSQEFTPLFINIGAALFEKGSLDSALFYFEKSIDILEELGDPRRTLSSFYSDLGYTLLEKGEFEKSFYYLKKAVEKQLSYPNVDFALLSGEYQRLGIWYMQSGDMAKSREVLNTAIESFKKVSNKSPILAESYNVLGEGFLEERKYDEALESYQNAISSNTVFFENLDAFDNPNSTDYLSANHLLRSLKGKADVLIGIYKDSGEYRFLNEGLDVYEICDSLIDENLNSLFEEQDKLNLREYSKALYEVAIAKNLEAYNLTGNNQYMNKTFYYIERSKDASLRNALSQSQSIRVGNVPDSLLAQENVLRKDISFYKRSLAEERLKTSEYDSSKVELFERKLFILKNRQENLIDFFEKNYAEYHRLKYSPNIIHIESIQRQLNTKELVLDYFLGDSLIFVSAITKNQFKVIELKDSESIAKKIDTFRNELRLEDIVGLDQEFKSFLDNSTELYDMLANPILSLKEFDNTKILTIIPDGELGYIPFGILIDKLPENENSTDYKSLNYLLKKYQIKYGYSATLLFGESKKDELKTKDNFIAFAPIYNESEVDSVRSIKLGKFRDAFVSLEFNQSEAKNARETMGGVSRTGEDALERSFKDIAGNSRIIHLAMHAFVDDEQPMNSRLVFTQSKDSLEDGFLYAYELYNMEIPADLAVLSACETGYGKLAKGEGIMSLGRAFLYAGCRSIVMSHWLTNDKSTSELMGYFYENLSEGQSKDEALRNAKLSYLTNADGIKSHPYFWGQFVAVGDMSPIANERYDPVKVFIAGLFLIIIALLVSGRKRIRNVLNI